MKILFTSFILLFSTLSLFAKIELSPLFSDNMVLQQQSEAPLWGKAAPHKKIRVITSWDKQIYNTLAEADGSWNVNVKTPQAGGPYTISISDGKGQDRKLNNVMIGEVWICSGQSNMEMPLAGWGKILNYEQEITASNYPNIRLLKADKATSYQPGTDLKVSTGGWQVCSPTTIAEFSSVAYFFGRNLNQNMDNVPIGLINTSWGGTIAEAWTSGESLQTMPDFQDSVEVIKSLTEEKQPLMPGKTVVEAQSSNPNRATVLYNAMIYPIVPYTIKGAIWYQGESNVDRAYQYRELFPLMIRDWRKQWNSNFPFYFVQLANFKETKTEPQESNWAELREAQLQTLRLENTGMAVAIDIGDAKDIHPKNKQEVGNRLALAARANTYGHKIVCSGPVYHSYQIEGDKIRVKFTNTDGGLKSKSNSFLKGFAIAGSDHQFHWAKAVIDGNDVVVSNAEVPFPTAVRYAWADNPECNLYNVADLPASPFRTDDWKRKDSEKE